MTQGNVGRSLSLSERVRLWRLRRQVEAARRRLRRGRGDAIDAIAVMAWDDPERLAAAMKAICEAGITVGDVAETISRLLRLQSDLERRT